MGHPNRDEVVALVSQHNGILSLCQAMKDMPLNQVLQCSAIGALRNIVYGSDAHKTYAVRAKAIPVIVTAMTRFQPDAKLQEQAIAALTSISDTVGRAALCARQGGIEAVVGAMKRHPSTGHVAELGCIILCMFCDDGQLRQHITRCHALPVAKSLSRADQSEVRRWGCELLRQLSDATHARSG